MKNSLSFFRRLTATAAVCSFMAVAAPSQAAIVASFDPAFGVSIPNLGYRGTITLDVTDACYQLGTGFQNTGGACQITATSAQINYYSLTTGPGTILTTVSLDMNFFDPSYVFGAYYDESGQITGLDTNNSAQFAVEIPDLVPPYTNGSMLLYFQSGFARPPIGVIGRFPSAEAVVPESSSPGVGGSYLINCKPANQQESACIRGTSDTSAPGVLTFTNIPEPGSISLGLLGLGALMAMRRRTRKTSAGRATAV